ncbi:phytoene desaturase family protein [Paenibacillus methanolicus]|uniref:Phytoene desaturase n=1 Tax=Paenibacillus methanolicus TaxID=582686 RepID=A0A5S5CID0_9BACL|nr:phytoene desaturase family protein [Paenibacillus methanolicus]TYP79510.1 phytoene desaturase [Paenibacillus methanolicus]
MDIAIVGGGVGGMTAALLLSRQGMNVTIYERSAKLGGRLAYEEGGGYRIDQGPTIVLLPELLLSILEEAGIERGRIPLAACQPLYRIHYADGTILHKYQNKARQIEELERHFPGEAAGFERYMTDMANVYDQGKPAFLDRPFLRKRDFFRIRNLKLLARLHAFKSVRKLAASYFYDERLIDAFSLQTLYIGGAPSRTPGLYSLIPYAEHAYGVWYLKGGYAGLADLLARELADRGVRIRLNAEVEELLTSNGACRGVRVQGKVITHDAVVFNGDYPGISRLLPQRANKLVKAYEPSSGCLLVYLGLNKRWPEASVHQFFLPPRLNDTLRQVFAERRVPDEPSFYCFYPGAIDDSAAPEGESVMYMLVPVPSSDHVDWEAEAGPLAERVIEEAERRGFPGLRAAVRWMKIRTPRDAEADGLYGGGSFGIAPLLAQSAVFRPQLAPLPVANLYAVGASTHPGGGVPIVMQGARLLANHIVKEMA